MKTAIVAINSKYIHASLAPWYLKAACGSDCGEIKVLEYTINDSLDSILASIYTESADIVAFSCYIWNITYVLRLADNLRKVLPELIIILGGPEVSYDGVRVMGENPSIDYILSGEGETTFKLLLTAIRNKWDRLESIRGLTYREAGQTVGSPEFILEENLDELPSPYTQEMIDRIGGKIAYFESSRGCPFSCSYCISSTFEGTRYFSMERVKDDLKKLMNADIRLVKFVDRTFNCNRSRTKEIFNFILEHASKTCFHFEVAADLFDEEILDILSRFPKGLVQFEIGVQTVNPDALKAIERKTNLEKVFNYIQQLKSMRNVHIHLDLIAGLPLENYESFKHSFNRLYGLQPNQLQLGFLKLLKGAKIRREAARYGYQYREYPPYEVLFNQYISYAELLELKGIEEVLERYYNSCRFQHTLKYCVERLFKNPFEFFKDFYTYNYEHGYLDRPISSRDCYTVLKGYIGTKTENDSLVLVNELLKLDYLASDNSNNLPAGIERTFPRNFNERCFEFLKNEGNIREYLPRFVGMAPKNIFKQVHFEIFELDIAGEEYKRLNHVIVFDYSRRDTVTGLYAYERIGF